MTTIDTTDFEAVEKDLHFCLRKRVSAVVNANNAWLSALESFFEGNDESTKKFINKI